MKKLKFLRGFTLVELLVVISIIGFLTVASIVTFNIVRMSARDATRVADVSTLRRSLSMYLNDSQTGYPASGGECLSSSSGVGATLKAGQVIIEVPVDPLSLWVASVPNPVPTPTPPYTSDNDGFCYYYVSNDKDQFQIYYFLESNSKSGNAGPNLTTQ